MPLLALLPTRRDDNKHMTNQRLYVVTFQGRTLYGPAPKADCDFYTQLYGGTVEYTWNVKERDL